MISTIVGVFKGLHFEICNIFSDPFLIHVVWIYEYISDIEEEYALSLPPAQEVEISNEPLMEFEADDIDDYTPEQSYRGQFYFRFQKRIQLKYNCIDDFTIVYAIRCLYMVRISIHRVNCEYIVVYLAPENNAYTNRSGNYLCYNRGRVEIVIHM